jgi:hypothetical protein
MAGNVQRTVRTPDGRTLAVEEAGDPGGPPFSLTWARRPRPVAGRARPGAQARLYPEDGHLTLLENRVGGVHAWLAGYL